MGKKKNGKGGEVGTEAMREVERVEDESSTGEVELAGAEREKSVAGEAPEVCTGTGEENSVVSENEGSPATGAMLKIESTEKGQVGEALCDGTALQSTVSSVAMARAQHE